jgi:hypothetical protein
MEFDFPNTGRGFEVKIVLYQNRVQPYELARFDLTAGGCKYTKILLSGNLGISLFSVSSSR